ncbi:MAG: VWA domain-containing protein [Chloracidobacterium sp.]|nr:VWA domain-containing protein [Chloracidobacterium sp.]
MRKVCKFHILTLWMIGIFSLIIAQQGGGKIKTETEPINIDVVVRDATGKRLPALEKEDFAIYEDGVLQDIALFKPAPHPLRLVLLFDTSVSMGASLPAIRDEAVNLVERLTQLDEIMIGAFDADLRWNSDWGGKALATSEILALKSTSNTEPISPGPRPRLPSPFPIPHGGRRGLPDKNTNLFGAMHTLFGRFGGRSGNEVVVLFSDGKDSLDNNLAKQRPIKDSKQVISEAQRSWAQIYSACFKIERESSGITIPIGGRGYSSDCKLLSDIAEATGGRSFEFESRGDLAQILNKILDELKSQYTLAYYPSSKENRAGFHKIKVVVNKPDIITRAREGYLVSY